MRRIFLLLPLVVSAVLVCSCSTPPAQTGGEREQRRSHAVSDPPLPGVKQHAVVEEQTAPAVQSEPANRPPEITSASFVGTPGGGLTIRVTTQDPENDPVELRYTWFINDEEVSRTDSIPPPKRGEAIRVDITADDHWHEPVTRTIDTIIKAQPPIVDRNEDLRIDNSGKLTYQILARDPEAEPLTYVLTKAPAGMTIDENGLVTWDTRNAPFGNYQATVRVQNTSLGSTDYTFQINLKKR